MLSVAIRKRLEDFTLDATWSTDARIVALVGPSGAGKTLTLQCIAGLSAPDEGAISCAGTTLFDSRAHTNLRPQARRIGYVFQGYALFPHMTVAENIAYGAKKAPATKWLESFGLSALRSRYPSQLSGGQQQRVAVARA